MQYKKIRHGSPDSIDKDYYIVIDKKLDTQQSKDFLNLLKEKYGQDFNGNLITIDPQSKTVSWSYKGTLDEVNNSIVTTFSWFKDEQEYTYCPVEQKVNRNHTLKTVRTVRGLLSYLSRTQYREEVKNALNSNTWNEKLNVLKNIDLTQIEDFKKSSITDTYKFIAFQIAQTLCLTKDSLEVFSKWDAARQYNELFSHIYRKNDASVDVLQKYLNMFVEHVQENILESKVPGQVYHKNLLETIDIKKEQVLKPVYVFDIDNTLMNDHHRAHLRDNKQWEEYFLACDKDTPIQVIIDILKEKKNEGFEIWLLTGRSDIAYEKTVDSLKNAGVEYDYLKMRGSGVKIPDYVLKPSWATKIIGAERIVAIYDDRDQVINAYRDKGLNVIDVNPIIEQAQNKKINLKP